MVIKKQETAMTKYEYDLTKVAYVVMKERILQKRVFISSDCRELF